MRIKHIEGVHVRVPLGAPYRNARGQMDAFDSVIVRIETDDGLVGYGESVPFNFSATDPRAHLGDARVQARLINGPIASALAGTDPLDIEALVTRAAELAGPNVDAIAGVDLALWDLMGKSLGQPAYRLLGGVCQDAIPVDFTIGARSPADTAAFALEVHRDGFQGVVVKVPCRSTAEDVERVRAVRSALPAHCTVRVDCNAGHTREGAIDFIRRIAEFDIEFVEQPVAAADLDGLRLCRSVGVPISADESLNTLRDAIDLVKRDACDVMNIKVPKVGGLLFSKRVAAVAAAAGLPVVVGGRTTLEPSRAASRHFATSTPVAVGRAHEGPGPASQGLSDDVAADRTTRETVKRHGGHVRVSQAPGLGVEVLWAKVAEYAVPA